MPSKVIQTALDRWKAADEAESQIRQDGVKCDAFFVGEQWPREVQQSRILANRPCLVINQTKKFVRQVTNDSRMNRPSVKVIPTRDSSEDTAKILEGMVRHIQVASDADIAYDTACESQVRKGWGYFRVITEYEDENSFDQVIKIKRIKNAFTVYVDPAAIEPDYSDAKFYFVCEDIPKEEFKKLYPKATMADDKSFSSTGDVPPDWQNQKMVRVAEYWEVVEDYETLCMMQDGSTKLKKDLAEGEEQLVKRTRETCLRKVLWRKITAGEVLEGGEEGQEWPGKYIPIIPVLGDDIDVDGRRYLQGMIHDMMDPQRQYNVLSTSMTESALVAPMAPWLIAEGQVEGYERFYENANVQNFAYLPYKPQTLNGQPLPPPQRITAEAPIAALSGLVGKANQDMMGVTGIFDAGLGKRSNETSGKAIMARQKEGDVANFNYLDNLARAIRYLGIILLDLIPKIYDAPRVIQIVGEDETTQTVHVNTPLGPDKKPVQTMDAMHSIYDLSAGKYDVVINVGPSFSTKRQESADAMTQLASAAPIVMEKAPDLVIKSMDFPLANELADRLRPPGVTDNKDIPPQAQAQMQQMGQMIQQLTQTVHQLQDEKEQKSAELASKERIAASANETALAIQAMKQESAAANALLMQELQHIGEMFGAQRQMMLAEHAQSIQPPPQEPVANTPQ